MQNGYKRAANLPRRVGRSLARTRGGDARLARSRCAALYTIGYEVAVTCSRPTDDHSVTRPRSTIPGFSGHQSVHLNARVFWNRKIVEAMLDYDILFLLDRTI